MAWLVTKFGRRRDKSQKVSKENLKFVFTSVLIFRICFKEISALINKVGKHICSKRKATNGGIQSWLNWEAIETTIYLKIPWTLIASHHLQTFPPVANTGNDNNYIGVCLFQMDRRHSFAPVEPIINTLWALRFCWAILNKDKIITAIWGCESRWSGAAWLRPCCGSLGASRVMVRQEMGQHAWWWAAWRQRRRARLQWMSGEEFLRVNCVGRKHLSVSFTRKLYFCCLNVSTDKISSSVDLLAVQFVNLTLQPVCCGRWWELRILNWSLVGAKM